MSTRGASLLTTPQWNSSTESVFLDNSANSNQMLVAFGGISGNIGMPPFEFFNATASSAVNRLFVRDLSQSWYHLGLQGLTSGIEDTADFIDGVLNRESIEYSVFVGNSMGGYAALLFGSLIGANRVIAFAPQTFIDRSHRLIYADLRWHGRISKLHRSKNVNRKHFDLREVLQRNSCKPVTQIHVAQHRLDKLHAARVSRIKNVSVQIHPEGGHALVRTLRENGVLARIIEDAFHGVTSFG